MKNKQAVFGFLGAILSALAFIASADEVSVLLDTKPDFKDYPAVVSEGSFSTQLRLTDLQQTYSQDWKNKTKKELKKPANLAGHYRVYIDSNNHGYECLDNRGGVCGWVIDKISGEVVGSIPYIDGSISYNQVADNGTPVGEEFRVDSQKKSSLIGFTGQAIPEEQKDKESGFSIFYECETNYYTFKNKKFTRVFVDKDGCSVD